MTTIVSEGASTETTNDFGWEKTKENFKPRAKGRNVKKLNTFAENISHSTALKEKQDMQREAFETSISTYDGDNPIKPWLKYIKWAETEFPSSTAVAMPLYERCTRAFFKNEQYRNSVKYLTVWLKYADELDDSSEVFRFLYANKIGEERSFFYIAWALVEEEKKRYALADKIYCRGLALGAKPENVLETRHTQFKRRMSRHWLKQAGDDIGADVVDSNLGNGREAFSMLNHKTASSTNREGTGGRLDENTGRRIGSRTGGGLAAPSFNDNSKVSTQGNFQIFVEEGFRAESGSDASDPKNLANAGDDLLQESASVPWDEFGTMTDRKKENEKNVSAWNAGGLYDNDSSSASKGRDRNGNPAPVVPAPKPNTFSICIDEEFEAAESNENQNSTLKSSDLKDQQSAKKVSLRRRIEGSAKRSKEELEVLELKANPFKNYEGNINADITNMEKRLVSDPMPAKFTGRNKSTENDHSKTSGKSSKNKRAEKLQGKKKGKHRKDKIKRKKSSNANVINGFNQALVGDNNGNEMCFEEHRGLRWQAKRRELDAERRRQVELAAEERKKALSTLQTSADDIVTEMRRKPFGTKKHARRATLCTITPNLQGLYQDNGEDNGDESSAIWSSDKKAVTNIDEIANSGFGAAKARSTARKILKFDATSSAKGSVISKQLCFSEAGRKSNEKDVSSKRESTARKVLNFNAASNSIDDVDTQRSLFMSAVKSNLDDQPQSPKTATRRLYFTGVKGSNDNSGVININDNENMTVNMKEALDDVGGLFNDIDNSPISNKIETSTAMASIRFIDGKSILNETGTLNCDFKNAVDSDEDSFGDGDAPSDNAAPDEMTLNMKAAMQDLGDLFCSPRGVLREYIDISNDEDALVSENIEEDKVAAKSDNANAPQSTFEIFKDGCVGEDVVTSTKGDPSITEGISQSEEELRMEKKSAAKFEIFEDVPQPKSTADNEAQESEIEAPLDPRSIQENLRGNFQPLVDGRLQIYNDNDSEDDAHVENKENETPPRGLSSRGRRVRTLEELGNEEIVLGEIALEVVEEEGDEDDLGDENIENETENPINIPSVRRVTARARSPLQVTQESVAVVSTVTDMLEITGVADNDDEVLAQAPPIVRDLSHPKYDFEIFEDDAESEEDEIEDFGIIDELGRLNTAENSDPAVEVNDENNNTSANDNGVAFTIYNDDDE